MYENEQNQYGCSLRNQSGRMAVRDFDAIVERLSPELRAAFIAERAARYAELHNFLAACATPNGAASVRYNLLRRVGALAQVRHVWFEQFPAKAARFDIHKRVARAIPRIAAHLAVPGKVAVAYPKPAWNLLRATRLGKSI